MEVMVAGVMVPQIRVHPATRIQQTAALPTLAPTKGERLAILEEKLPIDQGTQQLLTQQ
jgi:hypothetical protein